MIAPTGETGETVGAKQPPETPDGHEEKHTQKQSETIVPQRSQAVSKNLETIVSARGEDISKWRKYAVTYYNRSIKSVKPETRKENRETYEHYRDLLTAAGFILEEKERLIIHEPPKTNLP